MTEIEAIDRLKQLQRQDDIESHHNDADKVLCEFLIELGFRDLVNEWYKVPKWYA